jgi:hypothetical protein
MMTAEQYRDALARLRLSQLGAGRVLGLAPRTSRNYAAKGAPIPVAIILRLMLRGLVTAAEVQRISERFHR